MIVDISQLLQEPVGSQRRHRINEAGGFPVSGEVDLLRTDRGIYVSGTLETTLQATCSRCAAIFDHTLTLRIEEEYLPRGQEGTFVINNQEIDLSEAVRQYALLALPMKPLCSGDCAGICPSCGRNLNLGPCDCPEGDIDPRLASLASMRKDSL